jgi:hypothetical protein
MTSPFGVRWPGTALLFSRLVERSNNNPGALPEVNCTVAWSGKGKRESNKAAPGHRTPKRHLFVLDWRCNLNL